MTTPDPRGQAIAAELERFLTDLDGELGDRSVLARLEGDTSASGHGIAVWELTPTDPSALPIRIEIDETFARIIAGHNGGIWELHDPRFTTDLITAMTRAVLDGHVEEVFGPGRSTVTLTLADGTPMFDTGIYGIRNMLTPRPGWRRRGQRVTYSPYR